MLLPTLFEIYNTATLVIIDSTAVTVVFPFWLFLFPFFFLKTKLLFLSFIIWFIRFVTILLFCQFEFTRVFFSYNGFEIVLILLWDIKQGRSSEGTSIVVFEIPIIRNRFYKSVHPEPFNINYEFVQLQLFDINFLFFEEHIFRKQKRTLVYGRASLVLSFQLTRENNDLSSSRHK